MRFTQTVCDLWRDLPETLDVDVRLGPDLRVTTDLRHEAETFFVAAIFLIANESVAASLDSGQGLR